MAKEEVEEKATNAISEKEEVIRALEGVTKAFEEEKIDWKATKETIKVEAKEEALGDILKYGMSYKHSTLFMLKKKYPNLDFSDVALTQMEGYNVFDPSDGS